MIMALAAVLHETGHLLVMKFYKCLPSEIRFIPGSVQICSPVCLGKPTVLILFAGPLFNLMLYAVFRLLGIFTQFADINLIYAVFNLLPFYGFDGGGIIEEFIIRKKGAVFAQKVLKAVTIAGACVIFFIAMLMTVLGFANFSVCIVFLYLILSVIFKF